MCPRFYLIVQVRSYYILSKISAFEFKQSYSKVKYLIVDIPLIHLTQDLPLYFRLKVSKISHTC